VSAARAAIVGARSRAAVRMFMGRTYGVAMRVSCQQTPK
jgi:hypothetical protein